MRSWVARHDRLLGTAFLAGLTVLWFALSFRERDAHPELHALGLHDWAVECEGAGRAYRLRSFNISGHRSGEGVLQRGLDLLGPDGGRLYHTVRFDPDAYGRDGVWAFDAGWDSRVFAPRSRAAEVLRGDEARFEVSAALNRLDVVDVRGRRLSMACLPD